MTGVYTNEKHLRNLVKRCLAKNLTDAALQERGLQQLLARLRANEGGSAPRELLALAPSSATDLGAGGPLPLAHGAAPEAEIAMATAAASPAPVRRRKQQRAHHDQREVCMQQERRVARQRRYTM